MSTPTEKCRAALARAAPRAAVATHPTAGGRIESGDWARLDLLNTSCVQYAYLNPLEPDAAVLRLFPGDTLGQARILYGDSGRVDALLKLQRVAGWEVKPNMHFGYREGGYAWMHSTTDVEAYTNYWLAAMKRTGELKRDDWPKFFDELVSRGIATPHDKAVFDRDFTDTKRKTASPRPGLWCEKRMAASLTDTDALAREVAAELRVILRALREPLATVD